MDISVRVFLTPEDFIKLLVVASTHGGSILYHLTPNGPYRRVEPATPLPGELQELLRAPWTADSNHRLFIAMGDTGVDPDAVPPNQLITAYFGGFDQRALYVTPIAARSNDAETLALMRRLARWVKAQSKTGVLAWSEPVEAGDKPTTAAGVRYTEGALHLVRSGLQLRQRAVAHVHFEVAAEAADGPAVAGPR
jgi:hypothetical protein